MTRAVLDRCDELIRQERGVSLLDVMFGRSGVEHDLNDPAWAEPATYALQCALTAQWASIGIRPSAVLAQGSGRIAAAQAAGVFNLEEGLRIAAGLGELKQARTEPDLQAASESLQKTLDDVTLAAPSLPLVSSVSGQLVESVGELEIDYWLREDAGTHPAIRPRGDSGPTRRRCCGGIGPDSTMGRRIGDAWPDSLEAPVILSSLEKPPNDGGSPESDEGFVRAVAQVYEAGLDISFTGLFAGEVRRRIALPTYPFQRRRHWL